MGKILKSFFLVVLLSSFLVFITIFSALWYFSSDLPNYRFLQDYKPSVSTKVYDIDGSIVADFATQKRTFVAIDEIPPFVINAFLSAEDKNFFQHPGIDARGITRAIFKNLKNIVTGQRLEGASTITQQVAKNFLLSSDVSFSRKVKEAILAFRIEKYLTKKRILELYLNEIYLGERSYGIASASMTYFDKSLKELSINEAALLATLPKAPSTYNPYKNFNSALKRKNWVLERMYENKYINENLYKNLLKKPILLKKRKLDFYKENLFFTEEVRRFLFDKYGENTLYKRGLYVKTSLDSKTQDIATKALRENLEEYDRRHGWRGAIKNIKNVSSWKNQTSEIKFDEINNWNLALVISIQKNFSEIELLDGSKGRILIEDTKWARKYLNADSLGPVINDLSQVFQVNDLVWVQNKKNNIWLLKQIPKINGSVIISDPWTGRIYSMVGGYSFDLSQFNRSVQAKRQPGSAFKPFVYAAALENKFQPNSILLDAPYVMQQAKDPIKWKPDNYGNKFYGKSTLRSGVEQSRNLMTVRLTQSIGNQKILEFAKNLKIYENPKNLLSYSLGAGETTLINLTNAYSIFVNGGKIFEPSIIDLIQDESGKVIFKTNVYDCKNCDEIASDTTQFPTIENNKKNIIDNSTAYQMVSILQGVVERGTAKKMRNSKIPIAGKTGTTNNNMDAWFIGFTPDLVIGVYVGFDDPDTLGKFETGAKAAIPVFEDIIKKLPKKNISPFFKVPPGINLIKINNTTGILSQTDTGSSILESFKSNDQLKEKVIDLNLKLSTLY